MKGIIVLLHVHGPRSDIYIIFAVKFKSNQSIVKHSNPFTAETHLNKY